MTGPPDIDRDTSVEPPTEREEAAALPSGSGIKLLAFLVIGAAIVWVAGMALVGGGMMLMGGPDFDSALAREGDSTPPMMWDWEATSLDGEPFDFRDHQGEVLFVNLWATWCGPCVTEKPTVQKLHEELAGEGLRVITVSMDDDLVSPRVFMESRGYDMGAVHAWDVPGFTMGSRGLLLPTSFVVDREGRVALVHSGASNWASRDALAFFRKLLAEG